MTNTKTAFDSSSWDIICNVCTFKLFFIYILVKTTQTNNCQDKNIEKQMQIQSSKVVIFLCHQKIKCSIYSRDNITLLHSKIHYVTRYTNKWKYNHKYISRFKYKYANKYNICCQVKSIRSNNSGDTQWNHVLVVAKIFLIMGKLEYTIINIWEP